MSQQNPEVPLARRSFLSRIGAGVAAFGAAWAGTPADAAQAGAVSAPWQPARHSEDDWLDRIPGKHRFFFDTTSAAALGEAIFFANNYFNANRNGYGLQPPDLAVVLCLRHGSTSFAFTDEMWARYGAGLAERARNFVDPKTSAVPTVNVYGTTGYGSSLPNNGVTFDAIIKAGAHFAVCQMATRACAGAIARRTGRKIDDIYKELTEHMLPNARLVPAGIVAVNRAQERGYSFSYVG